MDDNKIVGLYWRRDEKALDETAAKYGKYCYSIAFNILCCEQDAEESVNDTYMGAWNSMPPHRPAVLSAFLGKLTRCAAFKKLRAEKAEKRGGGEVPLVLDELSECIPSCGSVEKAVDEKELACMIDRFLSTLPATERRVFVCRYWYLDSVDSISRQFGFSQSKTKSMLHRTRAKLLSVLKKEGVSNDN